MGKSAIAYLQVIGEIERVRRSSYGEIMLNLGLIGIRLDSACSVEFVTAKHMRVVVDWAACDVDEQSCT